MQKGLKGFKIKCIDNDESRFYTEGKLYDFEFGKGFLNDKNERVYTEIQSFKELVSKSRAQWELVKEFYKEASEEEIPKKQFKVGVAWEMYDYILVDANSEEEAIRIAEQNKDNYGLTLNPSYVEDSFQIDRDFCVEA